MRVRVSKGTLPESALFFSCQSVLLENILS